MEILKLFVAFFAARLLGSGLKVLPLLERAKTCPSLSGKGMDFLQAKHGLTLTYLVNLSYYILLKMRGVPVKGHPVLEELVKLRTLMEKMKPIDQKLQYQVKIALGNTLRPS